MDDMPALERQIGIVLGRMGGPEPEFDAMAIVRSVTASTPPGRWTAITRRLRGDTTPRTAGGFTMFSAVKFVAAGVIVALFGGFLLAGVLTTQQGDEMAPAAVTESPSPMTAEELLSGMLTEEVEPGVFRVVNDGVRDLSYPGVGHPSFTVDVTPDGSVWLSGAGDSHGLFRLGEEQVFDDPRVWPPYLEVAPDGSLWAFGEVSDTKKGIFSFDGEGWTERATTTDGRFTALAVGPDGTVWVTATDWYGCPDTTGADCVGTVLMRVEDDGTLTTIEDWADVYGGYVSPDELAVSPDGDVWLIGMVRWDGPEAEALLRFDGEGWERIAGPEGFLNHTSGQSLAFGPDGTLWVNASYIDDGAWDVGGLARFDDPGWTTFTEADGVERWGGQGLISTDLLKVATDGSLWLNGRPTVDGCGGVAHYDGTTWTSYLLDSCIHDLTIAPDGSVWLRASVDHWDGTAALYAYVITPEAVAATE